MICDQKSSDLRVSCSSGSPGVGYETVTNRTSAMQHELRTCPCFCSAEVLHLASAVQSSQDIAATNCPPVYTTNCKLALHGLWPLSPCLDKPQAALKKKLCSVVVSSGTRLAHSIGTCRWQSLQRKQSKFPLRICAHPLIICTQPPATQCSHCKSGTMAF